MNKELWDPMTLDGSLYRKVLPLTGLWIVGLGATGVRQGDAFADPYCANEAKADFSRDIW